MKRSVWLAMFIATLLGAAEKFIPPVPDVAIAEERRKILSSKTCGGMGQFVVLPPPVEKDFRACSNEYYKPDLPNAAYKLSVMTGKKVKVESVAIAEGFLRAYEINASIAGKVATRKLRLICDESVSRCYEIGTAYYETKDKK